MTVSSPFRHLSAMPGSFEKRRIRLPHIPLPLVCYPSFTYLWFSNKFGFLQASDISLQFQILAIWSLGAAYYVSIPRICPSVSCGAVRNTHANNPMARPLHKSGQVSRLLSERSSPSTLLISWLRRNRSRDQDLLGFCDTYVKDWCKSWHYICLYGSTCYAHRR